MLSRLLQQPDPQWYSPSPATEGIRLQYLGTAGFVIQHQGHTVVLDPFVSRDSLWKTLTQPLYSQPSLVKRLIPAANDVLIGHAHYDHILDAPLLCQQTGARLIGSSSTAMVGRAAGLAESQLVETTGHEDIASGDWTLRGLPSIHGKAVMGRIPFPGHMTTPPPWPPRIHQLKHGLVLNWLVKTAGLTFAHIDSADFIAEELQGHHCDVLCLCAIGRKYRPGYVADAVRLLKPKWVVPCHWDTMITPIEQRPDLLPGVDLPGMIVEIEAMGATPIVVPLLGSVHFPPAR